MGRNRELQPKKNLGRKLLALQGERSTSAAAADWGVQNSTLSDYISGRRKRPRVDILSRIASAEGVPLDWLVNDAQPVEPIPRVNVAVPGPAEDAAEEGVHWPLLLRTLLEDLVSTLAVEDAPSRAEVREIARRLQERLSPEPPACCRDGYGPTALLSALAGSLVMHPAVEALAEVWLRELRGQCSCGGDARSSAAGPR